MAVFLSVCLGPHLEQKSMDGFIAQPAFMPKDNIIPVTLRLDRQESNIKIETGHTLSSIAEGF